MDPIIEIELKNNWLKNENIELEQKRRRRYLHFDMVLEKVSPSTFRKISDPKFIEKYSFFPLIQKIQKTRLYKKDPETRKKVIKKKLRPISYAAHFDSLIYSWYAEQLEIQYEKRIGYFNLKENVIAYRKLGKSNLILAKEVFEFIKLNENCVAIALDIKGFYDSLNFNILKKAWSDLLSKNDLPLDHYKVYKSVTKFSYVDIEDIKKVLSIGKKEYKKLRFFLNINILSSLRAGKHIKINSKQGIPQGTPISCVLSNLYMLNFDVAVAQKIDKLGGLYRRYSDDIIIVCSQDKATYVKNILKKEIESIKLEIEDTKTEIRLFSKKNGITICTNLNGEKSELQYLGVKFDGQNMSLRHRGYAKFERKMTKSIRREVLRASKLKVAVAKRKIYEKFTPLGKKNYINYVKRAADILNSPQINYPIKDSKLFKKISKKIIKNNQ